MRNLIARALLPVAVGTTFVVPVGAALALSYHVAVREQQLLAGSIAGRMLDRANIVSEQIDHARAVLEDHPHERPCSPENIARMRELAIDASYLQAVGYVSGDRLLCSSYGEHGDGIPLGPADYLSSRGAWIRRSVELPFGSHRKFFVETDKWSGYSGLVLPDPILDAGRQDSQVSIALISISNRTVMLERGEVDVQKLPAFQREAGTVRWQAGDVGVIQFSASHDYAAVAAVPARVVRQAWRDAAMWIVPCGMGMGAALAGLTVLYARRRRRLPARLDRAMRSGELFLVYMPIVELASGRWVGAEALLRWQPRYGEAIEPGVFVPMAERHNRIRKLTATMLALFAADGREHLSQHAASLYFSLNLAAADLSDASVVTRVCRSRDAAGVRRIMVEATEGSLINFAKAGTQIRRLRDEGIRVAIDDFGTGYSSLSYLGSLQVDSIKIDASFVRAIGTDTARSQVIRHIIEMAKDLELDMIAEGVETRAQADYLRVCGVQYGQGWLFGRPMPAKQFIEAMIASRGALPD